MSIRPALALLLVCLGSAPATAQIFNNLLSPVLEIWVRSQVQQVEDLRVTVRGPDREIANGRIQGITFNGRNVLYKGISASQVNLSGTNIALNTAGALRGEGLKLLQPVRTDLSLRLTQQDVNAYLDSPGFQEQIRDLSVPLPATLGGTGQSVPLEIRQPDARLEPGRFVLMATLRVNQGEPTRTQLTTGIELVSPRQLRLVNPRLLSSGEQVSIPALAGLTINLGSEMEARRIEIQSGLLFLEGSFRLET
ncbi:DUF2993 domain-containing protein [Candidatus Cyanaurora vandensis]|uniref:LmeA family phospholipid-binding protein n=1 Tax=Candidatus Cyanaurora vandensis TaxID=2714958 RepID=UPI00257AEC4D|nr:DUF2993 domain-containing protein [Candidatus Cyanaurora vandensis]